MNSVPISGTLISIVQTEAVPGPRLWVEPKEEAAYGDPVAAIDYATVRPQLDILAAAHIHVMQTCRPRAVRHCAGPGGGRTSHHPPGHPFDRGQQSCRARRPAALLQDREKHNGGGVVKEHCTSSGYEFRQYSAGEEVERSGSRREAA